VLYAAEFSHDWFDELPTTPLRSVGCENATLPLDGFANVTALANVSETEWVLENIAETTAGGIDMTRLDWIPPHRVFYGLTVHLAPQTCQSAYDTITVNMGNFSMLTDTYVPATCALILEGNATGAVFKAAIATMRLNSIVERSQIMWGVVLAAAPGMQHMYAEPEQFNSFYFATKPEGGLMTWEEAYDACRQAPGNWRLATITQADERTFVKPLIAGGDVAIDLSMRFSPGVYNWSTLERADFYQDWDATEPSAGFAGRSCVAYRASGAEYHWFTVDCTAATLTYAMCESEEYEFSASVSLLADVSSFPPGTISQAYSASVLPAVNFTQPVWGATLEESFTDCTKGDRFRLAAAYDRSVTVHDTECVMMIAGHFTIETLNELMQQVQWRGIDPSRTSVAFNYMYWRHPYMRHLVYQPEDIRIFFTVPTWTLTAGNVVSGYAGVKTSQDICAALGAFVAQPQSTLDLQSMNRTLAFGPSALGTITHSGGAGCSATYVDDGNVANFTYFDPAFDLCTSDGSFGGTSVACLESSGDYWSRRQCSKMMPNVLCEIGDASGLSAESFGVPESGRFIDFAPYQKVAQSALARIKNDTAVHGVTVHLHPAHCLPGDVLFYQGLPTNVSFEYRPKTCSLVMTGTHDAEVYKDIIGGIYMDAVERNRVQLTFLIATSIVTGVTEGFHDFTVKENKAYIVVRKTSPVSWNQARTACQTLGDGFDLGLPQSEYANRLAASFGTMPVMAKRNPATLQMEDIAGNPLPYSMLRDDARLAPAGADCAVLGGDGWWHLAPCAPAVFTTYTCSSTDYAGAEGFSLMVNPNTVPKALNITAFPTEYQGSLPSASLLTPTYGVTVQGAVTTCTAFDMFYPLTTPVGQIVITEHRHCRLVAVGEETTGKYRTFLESLEFSTPAVNRSTVTIGYVLWLTRNIHDAFIDMDAQRVYYAVPGTVYLTPAAVTPPVAFTPPQDRCRSQGLAMAEPRSAVALHAAMAVSHRALTAINVSAGFVWGSDGAAVTAAIPLHVRANASHTVAAAMTRAAELMPTSIAHSTLCQSDSPALWNISTRVVNNETADPVDGRRWFTDGEWFMPFAAEEFGLRIPAEVDLYGLTVSLPEHQCRDGDRLLFTYQPPGLEYNYTSNCSAVMAGRATGLAYRLVLATTEFRQAAGASGVDPYHYRSLLHFSYLLWTSSLDGTSQALDADSRHAYTVLAPLGGANWDDAYDLCAALGPNWRLPVIESRHEARVLDYAMTPRRDYLLGLFDSTWTHQTPLVYKRWAPGQPENVNDDCAVATADGWNDVHCDGHRVSEVVCEYVATEYAFAGSSAWLFNYSTVTPFRELDGPFTLADLPDTNGTALETVEVYGATVQQPSVMCYPMQIDTFFPSASSDRIALRKSERCAMMFVGPALLSEYNAVVAGIVFRTLDRPRVNSSFGYVYWSTPLIRDLVLDVNLHGHTHTVFGPVVNSFDRSADAWSPNVTCALVPGFAFAEPRERTSMDELRVLRRDYAVLDVAPLAATAPPGGSSGPATTRRSRRTRRRGTRRPPLAPTART